MDGKVVLALKYVTGRGSRPGTTLVYIKGKQNVRVIMELTVPERFIFGLTLSIVMVRRVL